jgi:hypothetical protein
VVAGATVVLFGGFLLAGVLTTQPSDDSRPGAGASASPSAQPSGSLRAEPTNAAERSSRTDILPGVDLVTEEVGPGVLRIVSDDAGHDLGERHPSFSYDMDRIAIAPDGTVWLTTTFSRSDNKANPPGPLVWALGVPGSYTLEEGVLESLGDMLFLPDGTPLVIGEEGVRRLDGERFVPDNGPMLRQLAGGRLLLRIASADLASQVTGLGSGSLPDLLVLWEDGTGWTILGELGREGIQARGGWCTPGPQLRGVSCQREDGSFTTYLAGIPINQIAAAPDGSVWAVGGFAGDNGGLYRITLE